MHYSSVQQTKSNQQNQLLIQFVLCFLGNAMDADAHIGIKWLTRTRIYIIEVHLLATLLFLFRIFNSNPFQQIDELNCEQIFFLAINRFFCLPNSIVSSFCKQYAEIVDMIFTSLFLSFRSTAQTFCNENIHYQVLWFIFIEVLAIFVYFCLSPHLSHCLRLNLVET